MVRSPQTLSEADRRTVAAWAADCADRVLELFEAECPGDMRPRNAMARTHAFARGDLDVATEIRRRFDAHDASRAVSTPAAAAARAAGRAASIPHMGAHALGAAAYAAKAAGLAAPNRPEAVTEEVRWQLDGMSVATRAALRRLPPVGENRSGPLGPGLLAWAFSARSSVSFRPAFSLPLCMRSSSEGAVTQLSMSKPCYRTPGRTRDAHGACSPPPHQPPFQPAGALRSAPESVFYAATAAA